MKRFVIPGVVALLVMVASQGWAVAPQVKTEGIEVQLDTTNLKENVSAFVRQMFTAKGHSIDFGPEGISIKESLPVQINGMTFFAVKLELTREDGKGPENKDELKFIVDPTGTMKFPYVSSIATGKEMVLSAIPEFTKIEFPEDLAPVMKTGTGTHEVIVVTDPFCPACRKAKPFFDSQMNNIKTLKIAHWALPIHPGADAAVWVMDYAIESKIHPQEVYDFAYGDLKTPGKGLVEEKAQRFVIDQFATKFPKLVTGNNEAFYYFLKGKYEAKYKEASDQYRAMKFSGTPTIIIDGQAAGFNPAAVSQALSTPKRMATK